MAIDRQLNTFYLGKYFYGIDVAKVQEVVSYKVMTAVPLAPSVIVGLINLRGQILVSVDLRRRLNLPERTHEQWEKSTIIVVRTNTAGVICLVVDEIGGVMEVPESIFERPPEMISGVARELITGSYKLKDRLLLVLDVEKVVDIPCEVAVE